MKLSLTDNRVLTALKMAIAGAIAFLVYCRFDTAMGFWSIVTIAAITQGTIHDTFVKTAMRALGTIVGAIVGAGCVFVAHHNPYILMVLVFVFIMGTSYVSLQKTPYAYGGIVAGMTIAIVVFFSVIDSNIYDIAIYRTVEILLGVLILVILNISILSIKGRLWISLKHTSVLFRRSNLVWGVKYLLPAAKVALTCLLSFFIWYYFNLPEGYWLAITCLLIMEEEKSLTFQNGFFRLWAHLIAVLVSFVVALIMSPLDFEWRIIPLVLIFFVCGYLIGMKSKYSNMGNTIAVAMSILLLASPFYQTDKALIYARFYNVLLGIVMAFSVLALSMDNFKWLLQKCRKK